MSAHEVICEGPHAGAFCMYVQRETTRLRTFSLLGEKREGVVFSRPLRALRRIDHIHEAGALSFPIFSLPTFLARWLPWCNMLEREIV